jgi:hypothetical protein
VELRILLTGGSCVLRLDIDAIARSLLEVERGWPEINEELQRMKVGRKGAFTPVLRANMLAAYEYLDELLDRDVEPFTDSGMEHMLALNMRVHYGQDPRLIEQFGRAIDATIDKFNANVEVIANWYWAHYRRGAHPYKLAAETYVSIVGQPQLFLEGNHRTAALIGSWIDMRANCPPFVLSVDNAVAYFVPPSEIKQFADRSTWRGRRRLPQYRQEFGVFWQSHVDAKYVRQVFHCS